MPGNLRTGSLVLDPTSWDARVRLVMAIALSLLTAAVSDIEPLLMLLAVTLVAMAACRPLPWSRLAKRLLGLAAFLVLIWLTIPWIWVDGRIGMDETGLRTARILTLRTLVIGIGMSVMLARMNAWAFSRALAGIGMPSKLVQLMLLTARYIEVYAQVRRTLERAMRARGFVASPTPRAFAALGQLLARLVWLAFERARRVEWAMRARRYDGATRDLEAVSMPALEVVGAAAIFLVIAAGVIALR